MNEPVIKKVANGYLVYPRRPDHQFTEDKEVFVFSTWEETVKYLYETLEKKDLAEGKEGGK